MYPWIVIGPVVIPTFFVVNAIIASLAFLWTMNRADKSKSNLKFVADLTFILMVSALIGARLFHVFYENWDYYKIHPLNIFFLWEGGFVFYGGFILALIVGVLFARRYQQDPIEYLDLYAPVISLSYGLGRIGCLLTGCCFGKYCDLPWAINSRHPTQLYSTVWELGVLCLLLGFEKKSRRPVGFIFALWMLLHSLGRFLIEFFRDDFRGPSAVLSVSSWISLILFILALCWLLKLWKNFSSNT